MCDNPQYAGHGGMAEYMRQLTAIIKEHGWAVQKVMPGEGTPAFAYTIGLHQFGLPELLMSGASFEAMQHIINMAATMCVGEDGRSFETERPYLNLIESRESNTDLPVVFREIHSHFYDEWMGSAVRFYGHREFKALQLYWSDEMGLLPWEPGFNPRMMKAQPQLQNPASAHTVPAKPKGAAGGRPLQRHQGH
jgi:hypothetical protein